MLYFEACTFLHCLTNLTRDIILLLISHLIKMLYETIYISYSLQLTETLDLNPIYFSTVAMNSLPFLTIAYYVFMTVIRIVKVIESNHGTARIGTHILWI